MQNVTIRLGVVIPMVLCQVHNTGNSPLRVLTIEMAGMVSDSRKQNERVKSRNALSRIALL